MKGSRVEFQTGYDEPLLHAMYVDKTLSGIKAVQTLSRLNRAHPKKHDVFVLDFLNDTDAIAKAFSSYYRTTILAEETDPDKLHDLQSDLDGAQVYSPDQVREFVKRYLDGVQERSQGVRPHLRLPLLDSPLQQPGLGGVLDLLQLPHPEAAVAGGG